MGITDYLSRNPNDTKKGEEDDGMLTIMLSNDLKNKKNRQIKERVLSKLLKHRKKLIKTRNKACETTNSKTKKQIRHSDRKLTKKTTKHRKIEHVQRVCEQFGEDQRPKSVLALDKKINNCFSQLVADQNRANSFTKCKQKRVCLTSSKFQTLLNAIKLRI